MLFPVALWIFVCLDVVRNEDSTTTTISTSTGKSTTASDTTTAAETTSATTSAFESSSTGDYVWTTTSTAGPTVNPLYDWVDMEQDESDKLVQFVVGEIQKLKKEHKELDDCQKLDLSSVLSGKKLNGKLAKYSVTLKVQPQVKEEDHCQQQNSTFINMHPEICEADVEERDRGGTKVNTLLRSTCLQVEELQD